MRPLRLPFRRGRLFIWLPTARLILASNLAGLWCVAPALVLNEVRWTLVQARKESLREMGEIISSFLTETATDTLPYDDETPVLDEQKASYQLERIALQTSGASRLRIFSPLGQSVADSKLLRTRSTRPSCRT